MAPNAEVEDIITMTPSQSKVQNLKAAIIQWLINFLLKSTRIKSPQDDYCFTQSSLQCCPDQDKKITFEQYSRIHLAGPKIAICETASNAVFILNSAFTSKEQYFKTDIQEAILAFNNVLKDFGYTQTLEYYDPNVHQAHPPPQHPLFQ